MDSEDRPPMKIWPRCVCIDRCPFDWPFGFKLACQDHSDFVIATMAEPPLPPPLPCIVWQQESINQFEAPFADPVARTITTKTFFVYEPVLYQPSHLAQPVLTHISFITKEYFIVAASTTDRMVPLSQAQKVLKFKLTLEDVERELYAKSLNAGERVVWKRWVDDQNKREDRKGRLRAPCCGRSTFRYKLALNERGILSCERCSDAYASALYANYWGHTYPHSSCSEARSNQERDMEGENKCSATPPWRTPPAKRQKVAVSPEDLNAVLLSQPPHE